MAKKIHIIINPNAGRDEAILSIINRGLKDSDIEWSTSVTQQGRDAHKFAKEQIGKVDYIVAYGGDGTVMEVAQALYKQNTPMAIIPGGTANVMAKELDIPVDSAQALEILKNPESKLRKVDMALINDDPFFLRINMGKLADMVKNTDESAKGSVGQLAYGITAFKELINANTQNTKYNLMIDGEEHIEEGVALVVNNAGNMGFEGISMVPDIDVSDGLLDVVVVKSADIVDLIEMASSALLGTVTPPSIKRFSGKEIQIKTDAPQTIIRDDMPVEYNDINIKVVPKALNILAPA